MNEHEHERLDPLDRELAAFRPAEVSLDLRRRIAGQLDGDGPTRRPRTRRRAWALVVCGGLAAACLAALLARPGAPELDPGRPIVESRPLPPVLVAVERPTVQAYHLAAAESPEALDALLDRLSVRSALGNRQRVYVGALTQPDSEFPGDSGGY